MKQAGELQKQILEQKLKNIREAKKQLKAKVELIRLEIDKLNISETNLTIVLEKFGVKTPKIPKESESSDPEKLVKSNNF